MISSFLHEAMRLLARYENLALVVSALLGSAAIACAAFSLASILKKRSAKARGIVWRMAVVMLLVLGAWRLLPEMQEPVAVVQWEVRVEPVEIDLPIEMPTEPLVIPQPSLWSRVTRVADEHAQSIWLAAGALMLLWRVLAAWAGLAWLWRRSTKADNEVKKLGEVLGAPKGMRYRVAEKIASPMLTGWRKPVVWLPLEAREWDEARLAVVLRHELAHAQHADVLWHWLGTLAVCLWWWQPLAWMARRGLRLESEQAADDAAVLQSGDTQAYARTLVEIAAGMPAKLRHAAGVTMFGGGQVKQRVEALLRTNRWRGRIGLGAMVLLAILGLALAVLVATTFEFKPKKPVFRSIAKLVAGGPMVAKEQIQWHEIMQDFYGTIIETIESTEMQRKARERVISLHPGLNDHDVEIRIAQTKGSAIFNILATGDDPKHTQIFLNTLLDEFIAFRQSIREQSQGKVMSAFLKEVVNKQKVMEEKNEAYSKWNAKNNILAVTNTNQEAAPFLTHLKALRETLRTELAELEWEQGSIASAVAAAERDKAGRTLTQAERDYLQAQSELRKQLNEQKFLLQSHNETHPLVVEAKSKIEKCQLMTAELEEQLKRESRAQQEAVTRKLRVIEDQITQREKASLAVGALVAEHAQLKEEADVAKEAYRKLFEQAENFQNMFTAQSDYVAIQERATTAAEYSESSLFPVWKLWARKKVTSNE
jgi:beta-lactamase regulating signal transducer with metallopeptidase domain